MKKMKNPSFWAEVVLKDCIHSDNVTNLENMSKKYIITDQQKAMFREIANEYIDKIKSIIEQ